MDDFDANGNEAVDQLLLASVGDSLYGQPPQELAATGSARMQLPVGILA